MTDSLPRVVLVHGIHAAEGTSNMLRLIDPFNRAGFMVHVFEYGFLSVLGAMFANPYHASALASFLRRGCGTRPPTGLRCPLRGRARD